MHSRKYLVATLLVILSGNIVFMSQYWKSKPVSPLAPVQGIISRNFALPTPLFAPESAWNQKVTNALVLPESDQQILVLYRVLLGDDSTLHPPGIGLEYQFPFTNVNYDEYSIPVFRMGTGQQTVLMRDYEGNPTENNPKLPVGSEGRVNAPSSSGIVRPAGPSVYPESLGSDGHLVLYDPEMFVEYDFWQATTVLGDGGGQLGTTILEAGAIDFFDVLGSGANPDTYSSARATGTPLLAGLILPEDIENEAIMHALAFGIPGPRNTNVANPYEPHPSDYFYPASTTETDFFSSNPFALASGQRLRLKQTIVDEDGNLINENQLAPITRMFLGALRTYGCYLVDGSGGFTFYVEDIHTAVLHLSDDEINTLIGQPLDTSLPEGKTKWQIVIEKLNEELEQVPVAYGLWEEWQDPQRATINIHNFEVVEPVTPPPAFYVAPDGDDAGSGTVDQPWRTIQHAAEVMVAGDTVFIRDGVYKGQVSTVRDGNPVDGYIVFSAYPGETPVIDGTGVTKTRDACFFVSHSYIKLTGLEICNWDTGIWMEKGGHIEISDCEVHDVWFGVGAADGAHDFELRRVEIHHFTLYGFDASPSGGADCYNGTFNDCVAHTGRDLTQNVDGFALGHGTQHDFVFNRCVVYDVFDGFDISAGDTTLNRCSAHDCWNSGYKLWQDNVTLANCLSYHNEVTNVELDWDGEPGTTTLQNCHFVDSQTFNVWVENSADHLHMYNCILACGDNIGLAFEQIGVTNYQGDYNIFHNDNAERAIVVGYEDEFSLNQIAAGDWTTYSGQDHHSLVSFDPESELFLDLGNWDLHLTEESIAVDAAVSENAPSVDYDGANRPQGEGYDIGAYEIPEFPSNTMMLIILIASTVLIISMRRKHNW